MLGSGCWFRIFCPMGEISDCGNDVVGKLRVCRVGRLDDLLVGAGLEVLEDLDRLVGDVVVDGLREVALALRGGRHAVEILALRVLPQRLVVGEEKGLVPAVVQFRNGHRPADVDAAAPVAQHPLLLDSSAMERHSGCRSG